ncbi:MAG: transcription factor S [Candidatus Pacearchaeota archaeon]|nr:MAG: transcription factor S [Candidatus Pacearchaeota archaeon]
MKFCPKCGAILVQKKKNFSCPKCGHRSKEKIKIISSEKVGKVTKIDVLHEKDSSVWPVVTETCPECGNDKAYYFSAQMRSGDEAETQFFKCVRCKKTWRKYS